MKPIRTFAIFILGATIILNSCKKSEVDPMPPAPVPTTLNELKAPDSFNWSTAQTVELMITGLPTVIPVKNTLIISRPDGQILFSRLHTMSEDLTVKITVPSIDKKLVIKYGTVSYTADILNNQAKFSFIPVIVE